MSRFNAGTYVFTMREYVVVTNATVRLIVSRKSAILGLNMNDAKDANEIKEIGMAISDNDENEIRIVR